MPDILASAGSDVIYWSDLGLRPGIDLGFFQLKYYSLAYLFGLFFAFWHLSRMIKAPGAPMGQVHVEDLFTYCFLGVIVGGRLGYATFYDPALWYTFEPNTLVSWRLLRMWDGGMSFHGGLIGVVIAIAGVSWRGGLSFIRVCDYIAVNVGMGMMLGRLANFINGELWGRPAGEGALIRMIFPTGGEIPRHPSQLYQAFGEGFVILAVMLCLFWFTRARFRPGLLVGMFTAMMGVARITSEFFRSPDAQLRWVVEQTGLSMGQWLSVPLVVLGFGIIMWSLTRPALGSGTAAGQYSGAERQASDADKAGTA